MENYSGTMRDAIRTDALDGFGEFDVVYRVTYDDNTDELTVTRKLGSYAPDVMWNPDERFHDVECFTDEWTAQHRLTGQSGYQGCVMHESEYFSAGLLRTVARRMMCDDVADFDVATVVVYNLDADEDEGLSNSDIAGWAILTRDNLTA